MRLTSRVLDYHKAGLVIFLVLGFLLTGMSSKAFGKIKEADDKDISNHIESEFWVDESVPGNSIDIETNEGVVTLSGTVDNILAKDRAQKIAEATVGVRAVVNQIKVIPPYTITDNEIEKNIEQALLSDPATESYEVDVRVNDGVAVLDGTVDSWQERTLAINVAKGVKGVVDIQDNMNVVYKTDRTDFEIKKEVERRLADDVTVDDALIDVSVKDETVYLDGTVGSLQEKNKAESDAWVGGVELVKADDLEVKWWARDSMRRKNLYKSRDEEDIKKAVEDAFVYDPRVFSFDIDVEVDFHTVTLSGVVDNLAAKRAAKKDALSTTGVHRVINNIKVRPVVTLSDNDLEEKVRKALLDDPYIDRYELDVSAYGGVVYLSGKVSTSWEKYRAEDLAEKVEGVVDINNNIEYNKVWLWKADWEIREQVEDQLAWSPFVDEDDVNVKVDNGKVTLTGKVDNHSERQTAEENAYEGGAKSVENKLRIERRDYGPHHPSGFYGYFPY